MLPTKDLVDCHKSVSKAEWITHKISRTYLLKFKKQSTYMKPERVYKSSIGGYGDFPKSSVSKAEGAEASSRKKDNFMPGAPFGGGRITKKETPRKKSK